MSNPPTGNRLQIATRIHFLMLRELGLRVEVGKMLKRPLYARDVLLVCDAHKGSELARLSQCFRAAPDGDAHPAAPSGFEQSTTSADTSAFGASQSATAVEPHAPPRRSWFDRLRA